MRTEGRAHSRCRRCGTGVALRADGPVRKNVRGDRQPLRGWALRRRSAVALVVLWLLPCFAWAQKGPGFAVSLELMVSEADVIVQGTVERVTRRDLPTGYELDVVVRVTETIKGPPRDYIEFNEVDRSLTQLNVQQQYFTEWMTAARPFLWFFKANQRYAPGSAEPEGRHPLTRRSDLFTWSGSLIPLGPVVRVFPYGLDFPTGYLTTELQVIRRPEDILATVRAEVVRGAQRPRAGKQNVGIPWDVMDLIGRAQDDYLQRFAVPIDERTEALCLRMLRSPASIQAAPASTGWSGINPLGWIRQAGVHCLKPFRSDQNIALLKSLLTDREVVTTNDPQNVQRRVYVVRKGAFEVLQSWGVAIPTPSFEPTP